MDTIDDRKLRVQDAAREYAQAWRDLRRGLVPEDQRKQLENRRAVWEAELRARLSDWLAYLVRACEDADLNVSITDSPELERMIRDLRTRVATLEEYARKLQRALQTMPNFNKPPTST